MGEGLAEGEAFLKRLYPHRQDGGAGDFYMVSLEMFDSFYCFPYSFEFI